mmetsp:Transcript_1447/g.4342  ORF Transcript_1447/g.4342 Transcript_1447/m.4342 type:complete len:161 (-) Transcript_1447:123-605(-)
MCLINHALDQVLTCVAMVVASPGRVLHHLLHEILPAHGNLLGAVSDPAGIRCKVCLFDPRSKLAQEEVWKSKGRQHLRWHLVSARVKRQYEGISTLPVGRTYLQTCPLRLSRFRTGSSGPGTNMKVVSPAISGKLPIMLPRARKFASYSSTMSEILAALE